METFLHPVHRGIVAVMTDPAGDQRRPELARLLHRALDLAGITAHCRDTVTDRLDGLAALVRPVDELPKTLLVGTVAPTLGRLVAERNAATPGPPLRLRVVVHAGEVHRDPRGFFGEALDIAFRLLAAPRVAEFARAIDDPAVVVISEEIYWSIVRHGYAGIDRREYVPLVRIQSGRRRHGYVHIGSWRGALADSGTAPTGC